MKEIKEIKNIDRDIIINEIEKWAWLKYRLSGKRAMNTFIFTNSKKNNLSEEEINKLMDNLDKKIRNYTQFNTKKKQVEDNTFTITEGGKVKVVNF